MHPDIILNQPQHSIINKNNEFIQLPINLTYFPFICLQSLNTDTYFIRSTTLHLGFKHISFIKCQYPRKWYEAGKKSRLWAAGIYGYGTVKWPSFPKQPTRRLGRRHGGSTRSYRTASSEAKADKAEKGHHHRIRHLPLRVRNRQTILWECLHSRP